MRSTFKYVSIFFASLFFLTGCKTPSTYRKDADRVATDIILQKQKQALERFNPPLSHIDASCAQKWVWSGEEEK